ncbi:hypothetical protein [Lacticaseibacillus thailandensis]|uniref:Uncharacterized protein n=1 Tax=Lacticaseibacillus thailandensis DSM 22698 = JCM 13996 TaxID=1423810 RepID=A0A0R2CFN4_9LACO|nr:hypothetical protein [Lacticaseibacillus thailandensis]KRM87163.1 hypothetical protein FD19_GL001317 [Lacticaseibacillus thailandensis DSM 22698 = JCM 13996]
MVRQQQADDAAVDTVAHLAENAVLAKYPEMITTLDRPPAVRGYVLSLYIMAATSTAQLVLGEVVDASLVPPTEKFIPITLATRQQTLAGVMYYANLYHDRFRREYQTMVQRLTKWRREHGVDG